MDMFEEVSFDGIVYGVFVINAIVNACIISLKGKSKEKSNQLFEKNFWKAYMFVVPFFVTLNILRRLEEKAERKRELLNRDYEKVVRVWKKAAEEFGVKIQTPFILKDKELEIAYPILIESFGSKVGVIVLLRNDDRDLTILEKNGFIYSYVNLPLYSDFNRRYILDKLNFWGYFGDAIDRPIWYSGEIMG